MSKACRSPFFYVGDKYKIIDQIRLYFPQNIDKYVEPFVGGGSSFLNAEAKEYILNDIDKNLINLHNYLRKSSNKEKVFFNNAYNKINEYNLSCSAIGNFVDPDLKKKHVKTYYAHNNKLGYLKLRDYYNCNKSDLLSLYILLIYGFNRMLRYNSIGNFNIPVGNVDFNTNVKKSLQFYFEFHRKKKVVFHNKDYKKFIKSIDFSKNDFIYLDPPYLITNSEYNKLWNEKDEKELLSLLDELNNKGVKFAISNLISTSSKTNNIFNEWAKKYKIIEISSNYISYHNNSKNEKHREVLVINYDN
jgi:DNA adenine methylase Dam